MCRLNYLLVFIQIIFISHCDLSIEKREKLLNGFIEYYNNLPNQIYVCEEGVLQDVQELDENTFKIKANLRVSDIHSLDNIKHLLCTCTVQDIPSTSVTVLNNDYECVEQPLLVSSIEEVLPAVTEEPFERKPIQLDNEVQTDTAVTSGEQFIAVPREQPSAPCIGCATHIDTTAAGVNELANLGVKHIDRHDPNVRHSLNTVIEVERQVQAVNGIRYIFTLLIDYDNCTAENNESCNFPKTCKISILEKPWTKLPSGAKFRSILSNNCTEEWLFGDDGEVIDENLSNNNEGHKVLGSRHSNDNVDELIHAVHSEDIQSTQNNEQPLTDDQIKIIEEQIIPQKQLDDKISENMVASKPEMSKDHVEKANKPELFSQNSLDEETKHTVTISEEKRKTIEDLMNFFEVSGYSSKPTNENGRVKRSYDDDLQVLSVTDKFKKLKSSIDNAKYVYNFAQAMMDYINELDFYVKNRVLEEVIHAEEEVENNQDFVYLQVRASIPCDKIDCKSNDITKICNGVIDSSDIKHPQILSAFCHDEHKKIHLGKVNNIPLDDPLLHKLTEAAVAKIESESSYKNAMSLNKIIGASTKRIAGTITEISILIDFLNCTKERSPLSRKNCRSLDEMDPLFCEVTVHGRHLSKEKKITYTCVDRPIDSSFSKEVHSKNISADDPLVNEMLHKALQYLEAQSNKDNKQKLVEIKSITTQLNGGFLTTIKFIVGYTSCTNKNEDDLNSCKLLESQPLRMCKAEIWDRTWMVDGRQMEVDCKDKENTRKVSSKILNGLELQKTDKDRKYRSVNENYRFKRGIPGSSVEQDPNDPEITRLAEESLAKFMQSSGSSRPMSVLRVERASTQVVSGSLKKIDFIALCRDTGDMVKCHSEIWDRPWLKKKEIDVKCQMVENNHRSKRELIDGGISEKDSSDPQYKQLAEESMQKYLLIEGVVTPYKLIRVNRVTVQVVAGQLTNIDFIIAPDSSSDGLNCHSEIWEKSWEDFKRISVNCSPYSLILRQKREILNRDNIDTGNLSDKRKIKGGKINVKDPSKNEYRRLAQDALREYQQSHKSKYSYNVLEVKHISTKVVSGIVYFIDFSAVSQRPKHKRVFLNCHTRILKQPWLQKKKITVSCNPFEESSNSSSPKLQNKTSSKSFNQDIDKETYIEDTRNKRQIDDDIDDLDDELKFHYADMAVDHLNKMSDSKNLQKLQTIYSVQRSTHMDIDMVRMYIATAITYCVRNRDEADLNYCGEIPGIDHNLCLVKIFPSSDDEFIIDSVHVTCNTDDDFESVTGLNVRELMRASLAELEKSPTIAFKLVHQGEPQLIPSLDSNTPITLNFYIAETNCSKDVDEIKSQTDCFLDTHFMSRRCNSYIQMMPNTRVISKVDAYCAPKAGRKKRSLDSLSENSTDYLTIKKFVQEALDNLEMASVHRYKQRLIQVNSFHTKITNRKVTTIDFDVGYTSCLKYEWVANISSCSFLEHLPRRHCVAKVYEKLWIQNGEQIDVDCKDDETPLEPNVEFENAYMSMTLANEALKHIEAKYPSYRKYKVVRIFSLDKQAVAGIHYRMKIEIGLTDCLALSAKRDCKLSARDTDGNKFCRVNIWIRPWTSHPPNFRVTCDYHEAYNSDFYFQIQAERLFEDFVKTYRPDYMDDHSEMARRFYIFSDNVRKMHELNVRERGTATYGVTRFADLSYEEFTKRHLGLKPSLRDTNQIPMAQASIPKFGVPDQFDWRDYDAVTPVKDQGSCGSCWAFSVTGNIEGQYKLLSGQLISLSEQELVDCDKLDEGCNGGLPDNAYRAIEQLGGLETEQDYPYQGENDKCAFNKTIAKVRISGALNISSNETNMAKWLVHNGPISIGINANAMQFYMGGISHPWKMLCNPNNLDHGVLIVGYGIKEYPLFNKKLPYWTIKNSWGESWGEQGYYRVFRGDGTCGVNQMASSAVI